MKELHFTHYFIVSCKTIEFKEDFQWLKYDLNQLKKIITDDISRI